MAADQPSAPGIEPVAAGSSPPAARQCDECLVVFLSSSLSEVADERQALDEVLEASDLPLRVWRYEEDTGASSRSHMEVWRDRIERSDLYLGLFWKKFGKYTLDELNWARKHGKRTLLFAKTTEPEARAPELVKFLAEADDPESGVAFSLFETPEQFAVNAQRSLTLELVYGWRQSVKIGDQQTTTSDAGVALTNTPDGWQAARLPAAGLPVEQAVPAEEARQVRPPPQEPLGQDRALADVQDALRDGARVIGIAGESGSGKTTFARWLAGAGVAALRRSPDDGPSYPDGEGIAPQVEPGDGRNDVVMAVWEQFFRREGEAGGPSPAQALADLEVKRALVLLPEGGVSGDVLGWLAERMAGMTFVTEAPVGGTKLACEVTVAPLRPDDQRTVFQRTLVTAKRVVSEVSSALKHADVDGRPARIVHAANRFLDDPGAVIEDQAERMTAWALRFAGDLIPARFSRVARFCAALGVPVPRAVLDALPGVTPQNVDDAVLAGVLVPGSPRLKLAPGLEPLVEGSPALDARLRSEVVDTAVDWVVGATPDDLFHERAFVRVAMEWAEQAGRWRDVVAMGKALEASLALTSRWDSWDWALWMVGKAARNSGDQSSEAWARHQLGSQALFVGDDDAARDHLRQALRLRRRLGETSAAGLTRRNLGIVRSAVKTPRRVFAWLLAAIFAMLLVFGSDVLAGPPEPPGPFPPGRDDVLEVRKSADLNSDSIFGDPVTDVLLQPPGRLVDFEVIVENQGSEPVDLTSIVDSVFGDLTAECGARTIEPDEPYECSFRRQVTGDVGDRHENVVSVQAGDGTVVYTGQGTANITFVVDPPPPPPPLLPDGPALTASATFGALTSPEGPVVLRPLRVQALITAERWPVTVVAAHDPAAGDLEDLVGSGCRVPQDLDRGQAYRCGYWAAVGGNAGEEVTRIITVSVVDDRGRLGTGQGMASIEFTPRDPELEASLAATEAVAGETARLELTVHNRSDAGIEDPITLSVPVDDTGAAVNGCLEPPTLDGGPGAVPYVCTFEVQLPATAAGFHEVTVTVSGTDDEGALAEELVSALIPIVDQAIVVKVDTDPNAPRLDFPFVEPIAGVASEGTPLVIPVGQGPSSVVQGVVPEGWTLNDIKCDPPASATPGEGRVDVEVGVGMVVTCTYFYDGNRAEPRLEILEEVVEASAAGTLITVRNVGSEPVRVVDLRIEPVGSGPAPFEADGEGCIDTWLASGDPPGSCAFSVRATGSGPAYAVLTVSAVSESGGTTAGDQRVHLIIAP